MTHPVTMISISIQRHLVCAVVVQKYHCQFCSCGILCSPLQSILSKPLLEFFQESCLLRNKNSEEQPLQFFIRICGFKSPLTTVDKEGEHKLQISFIFSLFSRMSERGKMVPLKKTLPSSFQFRRVMVLNMFILQVLICQSSAFV